MAIKLSQRVMRIKPSPTLAVTQRAAELQAQGIDIVSLGAGEPDFDTPPHVKDAAIVAIQSGFTKYTAVDGIAPLKDAVIKKFKEDNGLHYTSHQVLVSCGGKQSFFNLAQAFLETGDEVIIPTPYWVSYPDMVLLADATPVIVETTMEQRFKLTPEALENAITGKTKLLVLNSPSNPSGMAYTRAELTALAEVLLAHPHVMIATDDMYEEILWTQEPFLNILMVCPDLYDRTIVLNGVSKSYSMTGWRIGYAAGPTDLIKAMTKIQSQSTSNPTSISQKAAVAALTGDKSYVKMMVKAFKERHDYLVEELNKLPGFECLAGDGTFYVFPRVQKLIDKLGLKDDYQLAELLIKEAHVALVPGSSFGSPGFVRLSFATSQETLEKAIERLKKFCQQ